MSRLARTIFIFFVYEVNAQIISSLYDFYYSMVDTERDRSFIPFIEPLPIVKAVLDLFVYTLGWSRKILLAIVGRRIYFYRLTTNPIQINMVFTILDILSGKVIHDFFVYTIRYCSCFRSFSVGRRYTRRSLNYSL